MDKINHSEYQYDTSKDVLIPFNIYQKIEGFVRLVEQSGVKRVYSDQVSWFNKETKERLSDKSLKKMKPEELNERYFQQLDLSKMEKTVTNQRTQESTLALSVLSELFGVFHHNIEQGNCIKKQHES